MVWTRCKEHGLEPAPDRPTIWATFVRPPAHDSLFPPSFKEMTGRSGVEILMTAHPASNLNAHAERFVGSIRAGERVVAGRSGEAYARREREW